MYILLYVKRLEIESYLWRLKEDREMIKSFTMKNKMIWVFKGINVGVPQEILTDQINTFDQEFW